MPPLECPKAKTRRLVDVVVGLDPVDDRVDEGDVVDVLAGGDAAAHPAVPDPTSGVGLRNPVGVDHDEAVALRQALDPVRGRELVTPSGAAVQTDEQWHRTVGKRRRDVEPVGAAVPARSSSCETVPTGAVGAASVTAGAVVGATALAGVVAAGVVVIDASVAAGAVAVVGSGGRRLRDDRCRTARCERGGAHDGHENAEPVHGSRLQRNLVISL